MTEQDHRRNTAAARAGEDALPPLAPDDAPAPERHRAFVARMVARHGAPSLADYQRTYAAAGVEWPGDEEIRRRHPVAEFSGGPAVTHPAA